jgi:uncharacterized protein
MTKRLLVPTLLMALITASSPTAGAAPGVPAFQITAPNGLQSILIGSMHVPHARLRQPSPRVLDDARALVIEHTTEDEKPDLTIAPEVEQARRDGKDTRASWAQSITPQQLQAIQARLACNPATAYSPAALERLLRLRSAKIMSMLAYTPCSPPGAQSRDAILEAGAAARQLPVFTLELQAEVERRRRSLDDRIFVTSLRYALATDVQAGSDKLVEALNQGDFERVAAMVAESTGGETESRSYYEVMVRGRNYAWMPPLRAALDAGRAVVLVGAGHLAGPDGLVSLLRRAGYGVQPTILPTEAP